MLPITRSRHRLGAAVLVSALALTAGCGTTVDGPDGSLSGQTGQGSLQPPGSSVGEGGYAVDASGNPLPEGGSDGSPQVAVPGGDGGGTLPDGSGATPSGEGPTGAVPGGADPADAPSSPPTAESGPIKIGLMYLTGTEAFGALGVDLSTGDSRSQGAAVATYVNEHGGIGGREIEMYYAPIDTAAALNNQVAARDAACRQLTEDDEVEFVISYLGFDENVMSCFAKAGVGVVNDSSHLSGAQMQKYAANFAAPADLATERALKVMVDSLWSRGWLTASSKVGVLTLDDAASSAIVNGALKSALAGHGLSIVATHAISNDSAGLSESGAAVLKFRTAGVDRVIPVNTSPLFMMNSASSQGYRPRYALYTTFGPGFLEGTAPADQLEGAAGIGWSPHLDVKPSRIGGPVSSNETLCLELMKDAGQTSTSGPTQAYQLQICNGFFYLAHAAQKVGAAPADLLVRARSTVGTSFSSAVTFKTDVTNRVDGVAAFRELSYVSSCRCFQYGALRPAG